MTFDSTDDYIKAQLKRVDEFAQSEGEFFGAVGSTHREVIERIFEEGLDSEGNKMPNYSTKPLTVKGKKYKGGYAEFKRERVKSTPSQGGWFDLTLTGEMRLEFATNVTFEDGAWTYSIVRNADKANQRRLKGIEVFKLSELESERHAKRIQRKLNKYLNGK